MLRRLSEHEQGAANAANETDFPALDQAFLLDERPVGVRFYKGRESFFCPYALLQGMTFKADLITLQFAETEVTISGRGLHPMYCMLANSRVACVIEQGERYAKSSDAVTFVKNIGLSLKQAS